MSNQPIFNKQRAQSNSNYQSGARNQNLKDSPFLDERVVQTIVQKLGYTDAEVRNYVATDKNSFVGVLYQKLLEDQNDRKLMMEKQSQLLQHQLQI